LDLSPAFGQEPLARTTVELSSESAVCRTRRNSYHWIVPTGGGLKSRRLVADDLHMDPSAIALQGLQQADAQLETAASRIASAGNTSPDGTPLDVVDLSAELVALMTAQNLFEANLATLKTDNQMHKALIDYQDLVDPYQTWQAFSATIG